MQGLRAAGARIAPRKRRDGHPSAVATFPSGRRTLMIRKFDHVTIVVRDLAAAKRFFALLGFKEVTSVVISGKVMEDYMGVPGIKADHVTLAIENPHTEVQLLHYHHPEAIPDANIAKLNKLGFNHVCFSVDDLEAEIAKLTAAGVKLRNRMMDFHDRKLVFLDGPEDVTIELAEWH
jgi:catechol 2,3-dioxygenase-like lactoylglutathione lyase family enzyme